MSNTAVGNSIQRIRPFNESDQEAEAWCNTEDIIQVNKWDQNELKNTLDDAARKILVDRYGCQEDNRLFDRRLMMSGAAVLLAIFALVYDYLNPFPKSRSMLTTCAIAYFVIMMLITLYMLYVEKGTFLIVTDGNGRIQLTSNMRKYDPEYELVLADPDKRVQGAETTTVGAMFDDNGHFHLLKYYRYMKKIYGQLNSARKQN